MIDDDTLILFAYGDELDEQDQARVAAAIDADPGLAARWRRLRGELDSLRLVEGRGAPELSVARWRRELDEAAARDAEGAAWAGRRRWLWPSAVAAALLVGIGVGVRMAGGPAIPATVVNTPVDEAARAGAVRGLSVYLDEGRVELARLADAGTSDDRQRAELVGDILARTRLYERAAVAQGAPELARVLRAFEQSLTPLVDEQIEPERWRADVQQLSFEFAALLTRIGPSASDRAVTL